MSKIYPQSQTLDNIVQSATDIVIGKSSGQSPRKEVISLVPKEGSQDVRSYPTDVTLIHYPFLILQTLKPKPSTEDRKNTIEVVDPETLDAIQVARLAHESGTYRSYEVETYKGIPLAQAYGDGRPVLLFLQKDANIYRLAAYNSIESTTALKRVEDLLR